MFQLADRLKKTIGEIMNMPASEFYGWLAYFKIVNQKKVTHDTTSPV